MATTGPSNDPNAKPDPAEETRNKARGRAQRARGKSRKQSKEEKQREEYARFFGIDPEGKSGSEIDQELDRAVYALARMGTEMMYGGIANSVAKVATKAMEAGHIPAKEAQAYAEAAKPTTHELDTGSQAVATVTRKWAPVWIKWAPELMLLVCVGGFIYSRKQLVNEIVSRAKRGEYDDGDEEGSGVKSD
jgi:hypothetical protein